MCTEGNYPSNKNELDLREEGYVTKWFYLNEELTALRNQVVLLEHRLEGLENTPLGIPCSYCGTMLETEADFAKHFVIPDKRYLNLGECPHDPNSKDAMSQY